MSLSPFRTDILKGKVAMVTGAGTGIGKVVALELARHGADLLLAARNVERLELVAEEIKDLGRRAVCSGTDVADPKQVKASVAKACDALGGLDILVNNAAANFIRPSRMLTSVRWQKVMDIVLNGTFYGCIEAGKHMLDKGSGSIVNIIAAYAWMGAPGLAPSASAKAGVMTLTKTLGAEWASQGVRVNAIAPGLIDTPQTRERLWPDEAMVEKMLKTIPAGDFGSEYDVSNLVLYLASDAAAYVTGEVITADGGQSLGRGALDMLDSLKPVRKRR